MVAQRPDGADRLPDKRTAPDKRIAPDKPTALDNRDKCAAPDKRDNRADPSFRDDVCGIAEAGFPYPCGRACFACDSGSGLPLMGGMPVSRRKRGGQRKTPSANEPPQLFQRISGNLIPLSLRNKGPRRSPQILRRNRGLPLASDDQLGAEYDDGFAGYPDFNRFPIID